MSARVVTSNRHWYDGQDLNVTPAEMLTLRSTAFWPWASFLKYVHEPMSAELGHSPDVYLCGSLLGPRPRQIEEVFELGAVKDQFTRAHKCYLEVAAKRRYDIFIKVRPDFVFTGAFPSIIDVDPSTVHSRFREAMNIKGLTSAHTSWYQCRHTCESSVNSETDFGYVNDDMIYVVPAALAHKVFMAEGDARRLGKRYAYPEHWFAPEEGFSETMFAKGLLAAGVFSRPLAIHGYPAEAGYDHKGQIGSCLWKTVPKAFCGDFQRSMDDVLEALRSSANASSTSASPKRH